VSHAIPAESQEEIVAFNFIGERTEVVQTVAMFIFSCENVIIT
jgi:hypothetical protein